MFPLIPTNRQVKFRTITFCQMTSMEMRRFATQELLKGKSYEAVYTDLGGRIHGRELEAITSAGIMKPWVKMA